MWFPVYQIALGLALVLSLPPLLLQRHRHYLSSLRSRLGFSWPAAEPVDRVWIHAVSVGEVGVATTLAEALSADEPLLVTTVTSTGQERARKSFPGAVVTYLPFDFAWLVERLFEAYRPRLLVLCEGDLWPAVLRSARRRGVPVIVVNGRLSDRSFRRMRRFRRLLSPLLDPVAWFCVQTATDRERLVALGVEPSRISVTGNLKFETPEPSLDASLAAFVGAQAAGRPILVAGSTMSDEEDSVLAAFSAAGGGRRALLVLAPRHPERWNEVADLLSRRGLCWKRRSAEPNDTAAAPDVLLLDSLGELAGLYRMATAAFIGGTLVATGGHNPLEAARFGVPVAAGPSMENFRAIADAFDAADAWRRVDSPEALAVCWRRWLSLPEEAAELGRRGAELVAGHGGALARTTAELDRWLVAHGSPR